MTYLLCLQACLLFPLPPNLIMSLQAAHFPQSGDWHTWGTQNVHTEILNIWCISMYCDADTTPSPTSQTPQRCLFTPTTSLSFCSIWSEKNVSKIWHTSLVVVAFVGPLLSFSILVGWRMACLLAALLSGEEQLSPWDQSAVNHLLICGEMALKPLAADTPHQAMQHKRQTKLNRNVWKIPICRSLYPRHITGKHFVCYRDAQPIELFLHPSEITTAGKLLFKCFLNDYISLPTCRHLKFSLVRFSKEIVLAPCKINKCIASPQYHTWALEFSPLINVLYKN